MIHDAHRGEVDARRFLKQHEHLSSPFGEGGFGQKAEAFARFFGTPKFIVIQTFIVLVWIVLNSRFIGWDIYPFILLNLAFSLQAAYAAPLILLAQTRQADRDKAHADADAAHREAIATETLASQALLKSLLDENTKLTQTVESLTAEIHGKMIP
jgi:uncharacterized membrane protein